MHNEVQESLNRQNVSLFVQCASAAHGSTENGDTA